MAITWPGLCSAPHLACFSLCLQNYLETKKERMDHMMEGQVGEGMDLLVERQAG